MELSYERLTAAIACGIRNGMRLAREEKRQEEQDIAVQKATDQKRYENAIPRNEDAT